MVMENNARAAWVVAAIFSHHLPSQRLLPPSQEIGAIQLTSSQLNAGVKIAGPPLNTAHVLNVGVQLSADTLRR